MYIHTYIHCIYDRPLGILMRSNLGPIETSLDPRDLGDIINTRVITPPLHAAPPLYNQLAFVFKTTNGRKRG